MFIIEIPFCDLDLLYFYGNQSYRWIRVNDGKYIIINGDKITLVQQKKNRKAFICSEDNFYDFWYDYFDVGYDYYESLMQVKKFSKVAKEKCFLIPFVLKQNKRVRILKTDILETMIYYAFENDNYFYKKVEYKKRRDSLKDEKMQSFCKVYGKKRHNTLDGISISWNEFPKIDDIPEDISEMSMLTHNERKKIQSIIYRLKENDSILNDLRASDDYDEIYEILQSILDDSVWIKNVMFYALGFKEAFAIRDQNKKTFYDLQLSPRDFKEFSNVKGFILEFFKVNENRSTRKEI